MSEILPVPEMIVPLSCDERTNSTALAGRRLRVSMGEMHKKIEAIDHAVGKGALIEIEINEQWSDVYSILASRWAGRVSTYMVVHQGRRHVLSRLRALPEWLRSEFTLYFMSLERGGLSTDERTLELLDLAQAFPKHQFEVISGRDLLWDSLEDRFRDGVLLRMGEGLDKRQSQSIFEGILLGLPQSERTLIRHLSSWWLKPLTYLMLLAVLIFYSLSSLLDRVFVGGIDLAQEAYSRARRSEQSRVKSGAMAAMAAARGLKRHPIVGQAKELRWQAEEVKWRVFDLKRHFWVHHAPVPWLKTYVPPAYGAIEMSKTAYWQAHRWYWRLFHWVSESRGLLRYYFVRTYWSVYGVWGFVKCKGLSSAWILRHPWSYLESRFPWLKVVRTIALKPYYFSKYQWEKRVLRVHIGTKVKS